MSDFKVQGEPWPLLAPIPTLGREMVKCFVNVRLHCILSNLKKISKMWMLPPCENSCGRPWSNEYKIGVLFAFGLPLLLANFHND